MFISLSKFFPYYKFETNVSKMVRAKVDIKLDIYLNMGKFVNNLVVYNFSPGKGIVDFNGQIKY